MFYVKGSRPLPREVLQCGRSCTSTSWMQVDTQSEWPRSIKKSAQTYIYQIKALEQLTKVTTVAQRHLGLQKKYGTKRVFWDYSG